MIKTILTKTDLLREQLTKVAVLPQHYITLLSGNR